MNEYRYNVYKLFDEIQECYCSMVDEKSKQLFKARLAFDMEPRFEILLKMLNNDELAQEYLEHLKPIKDKIKGKKIYLYGAGRMCLYFKTFIENIDKNANIIAVFDKNYNNKKIVDLPIIAPPDEKWVAEHDDYIICLSMINNNYLGEVIEFFNSIGVNKDKLITDITSICGLGEWKAKQITQLQTKQYFDYMDRYKAEGAFLDVGCYNGDTSVMFADKYKYSKIFAFEPEINNLEICKNNKAFMSLKNVELINAGAGKCKGTLCFEKGLGSSSFVSENGNTTIDIVTIDETVKDEKVSFIKMDIEGFELEALEGAQRTIKRDKPLCAICVYHKAGDVAIIARYLKQLVPEYKFALGQYSVEQWETVLYAFVD